MSVFKGAEIGISWFVRAVSSKKKICRNQLDIGRTFSISYSKGNDWENFSPDLKRWFPENLFPSLELKKGQNK